MDAGVIREQLKGRVILITGASGFTGAHACTYFAGLGMEVAAIIRNKGQTGIAVPSASSRIKYYSCNLLDSAELAVLTRKVSPDYVLHLGGKNSVPESWQRPIYYIESNVMAALYLLEALRDLPHCRILIAGSRLSFNLSKGTGAPHPYSLSKGLQKIAVQSWQELFQQDLMIAEPSNLIGPGHSTGFCSLLGRHIVIQELGKGQSPFQVSSRSHRRDFLDVRDAVEAYSILLVCGMSGGVYPICSGVERSLQEVTEGFQSLTQHTIPIEWGDDRSAGSRSPGLSPHLPADFLHSSGWQPRIPLSVSLSDILQYYRERKGEI